MRRRRFVELFGAAALVSLTDRLGGTSGAWRDGVPFGRLGDEGDDVRDALERTHTPIALDPSSPGIDAVAADVADAPIVGLGESAHGGAEFKTIPNLLVRPLVEDHGYRLLAVEETLGTLESINAYVVWGDGTLEEAMAPMDFWFWHTEEIRDAFEWLREFNDGRPEADRVHVRGYDAQFYHVNATAIETYLRHVDPAYYEEVADELEPLTTPAAEVYPDAAFATDAQLSLVEELEERLVEREADYAEEGSREEWELAVQQLWTLERGLQFVDAFTGDDLVRATEVRDSAMATNVQWLREWTGRDRVAVLGHTNHTMRGLTAGQEAARMGHHLADEFGSDYYSLGMQFGTGRVTDFDETAGEFVVIDLEEPFDETLEARLAELDPPELFLGFEEAAKDNALARLLAEDATIQYKIEGAEPQPVSDPPEKLVDGVVFVREITPASILDDFEPG